MGRNRVLDIDPSRFPTPCYICDLGSLRENLQVLGSVRQRTDCRILLALKGFAMFSTFPEIRKALDGVCCSSPHEAQLGAEEFGKEVHVYAPAYDPDRIREYFPFMDHMLFNSVGLWKRLGPMVREACPDAQFGFRVNPEYSEVAVDLYNPCIPGSRFGVLRKDLDLSLVSEMDGLHFHALCEQNADALEHTVEAFEARFADLVPGRKWLNLGGGHHITRPDYDIDRLCGIVSRLKETYGVQVYLEPGEAVALNTGILVTSVLDIVHNGMDIAILDTSASAHMPDVLEMPYRPMIEGASEPGVRAHTYRLGGLTCLAGDVIGDYSFDRPLRIGDKLMFLDMAHYTMVKNTTFNGLQLPSIGTYDPETDQLKIARKFGYEDYRGRLS